MSDLRRQLTLGAFVLALLALGTAVDLRRGDVDPVAQTATVRDGLVGRAIFCPPPARPENVSSRLAMLVGPEGELAVPGPEGQPETLEVTRSGTATSTTTTSTDVAAYGSDVVAGNVQTLLDPDPGAAAGACADVASDTWYFAEGSTALDFGQRFILYNPFEDEAVVRISLFTPKGELPRANLARVAVPSHETTVIALNEFVREQTTVGASIVADRGRVVAWRAMGAHSKEHPEGIAFSLGAPRLGKTWFLPEGSIGQGIDERISVVNPTDNEAIVSVSLFTSDEPVQPPKLVEVVVPPRTLAPLPLSRYVTGSQANIGGASAVVRATTGAVAVERNAFYESGGLNGIAAEVATDQVAPEWFVPPAAERPVTDAVVIQNPALEKVTVGVELFFNDGETLRPSPLQNVTVRGNSRRRLPIANWTAGRAVIAIVRAEGGDVVVERVASTAADVAAVIGRPLPSSMQTGL